MTALFTNDLISGDLEMSMGLNSYAESAQCTQVAEMFILDQKNYERLIEKRNPQALDILRDGMHEKLQLRLSFMQEDIPLFRYFLYKLDERKRHENDRYREIRRKANMFDWNKMFQKGPLIDQFGPGSIFYRIRMRNKSHSKLGGKAGPSGALGFGITKHLLLGRNHGAAYLSRKPVYSTDQNLNTPEPQVGANNPSRNSDADDNSDYEEESDVNDIDVDIVDSRKASGKSAKSDKSQIICENAKHAGENTKRIVKPQKVKKEKTIDEFKNLELTEFNLTRLETRIEQWHKKVDEIDENARASRKHLVKLHRYSTEVSNYYNF